MIDSNYRVSKPSEENYAIAKALVKQSPMDSLQKHRFANIKAFSDFKSNLLKDLKSKDIRKLVVNEFGILTEILDLFLNGFVRNYLYNKLIRDTEKSLDKIESIIKKTPLVHQTWREGYEKALTSGTILARTCGRRYRLKLATRLARRSIAPVADPKDKAANKTRRAQVKANRDLILKTLRIRSSYEKDLDKEFDRLTKAGFITEKVRKISFASLEAILDLPFQLMKLHTGKELHVAMGRNLELKALFKDSHYVFTHSQSQWHTIYNDVAQELLRILKPDDFNIIGSPFRVFDPAENKHKNIFDYMQLGRYGLWDANDSKYLLCVDGYFWSISVRGSALWFTAENVNAFGLDTDIIDGIFRSFMREIPDYGCYKNEVTNKLAAKAVILSTAKAQKANSTGASYGIMVEKTTLQNEETNFACQSGRGWNPNLKAQKYSHEIDELQEDNAKFGMLEDPPQYRLMTYRLAEETANGRAFALDCSFVGQEVRDEYRDSLQQLIREANLYKRLCALTKNSPDEEWEACAKEMALLGDNFDKELAAKIIENNQKEENRLYQRLSLLTVESPDAEWDACYTEMNRLENKISNLMIQSIIVSFVDKQIAKKGSFKDLETCSRRVEQNKDRFSLEALERINERLFWAKLDALTINSPDEDWNAFNAEIERVWVKIDREKLNQIIASKNK